MNRISSGIALLALLTLTACGMGPDSKKPEVSVVTSVSTEEASNTASASKEEIKQEQVQEPKEEKSQETEISDETGNPDTEEPVKEEEMKEPAKLLYQGHASLRITTPEGKVIYIDPFMGDGYDLPADLILETHGHYDHTQTKLISQKNDGCETITWKEAIKDKVHQTFDLGYVKVEAVEAGYNKNHNAKECVGFILTFSNGATLYVTGDTSTTPTMSELADRNLDYAFFCCDGVYNMDMNEAIECAKAVGAKHSIPYHMIPANNGGFDADVAETFDVPGRMILKPGDELELTVTE